MFSVTGGWEGLCGRGGCEGWEGLCGQGEVGCGGWGTVWMRWVWRMGEAVWTRRGGCGGWGDCVDERMGGAVWTKWVWRMGGAVWMRWV